MLDLYLWLFFMLIVSIGVQSIGRHIRSRGVKIFFFVLAFVGIFVHEMAHLVISNLFGVKTGRVRVKYFSDDRMRIAPHGSVALPEFERNSFVQTLVISVAPLIISTFLFLFCIDIVFNIKTEPWIDITAMFFIISLFIGSEPSGQDMRLIGLSFKKDPRYSMYQIFLILVSGLLVLIHVDLYFIFLPFEVLYYIEYFIFVAIFYFGLKFTFWLIVKVISVLGSKFNKTKMSSPKFLSRKRRFKEFKKQKEKEAQW